MLNKKSLSPFPLANNSNQHSIACFHESDDEFDASCKWNHTLFVLFCLACFTYYNVL